jgi:hypothetical protein
VLNWRISGATSGGEASRPGSVAIVVVTAPRGDGSPLLSNSRKLPSRGFITEWSAAAEVVGVVPEGGTLELDGGFIIVPYNS